MTREEILKLTDREVYRETAVRVMGWPRDGIATLLDLTNDSCGMDGMNRAWKVVEKMQELGYHATLSVMANGHRCGFWGGNYAAVTAATMPEAICRSALIAIEEQLPKHSE